MTTVVDHKRGDSFRLVDCQLLNDEGAAINLTGYGIDSQVRTSCGELVATLDVTLQPSGLSYNLVALDTTKWPAGTLECDIQYTDLDGFIFSTDTFKIELNKDITQ